MTALFVCAVTLVIAGAALGVLVVISRAIRREDRELTLTGNDVGWAALGTRRLTGASARVPGVIGEVGRHRKGLLPLLCPMLCLEG